MTIVITWKRSQEFSDNHFVQHGVFPTQRFSFSVDADNAKEFSAEGRKAFLVVDRNRNISIDLGEKDVDPTLQEFQATLIAEAQKIEEKRIAFLDQWKQKIAEWESLDAEKLEKQSLYIYKNDLERLTPDLQQRFAALKMRQQLETLEKAEQQVAQLSEIADDEAFRLSFRSISVSTVDLDDLLPRKRKVEKIASSQIERFNAIREAQWQAAADQKEAEKVAREARQEAEKVAWVEANGSEHLKKAVAAGYDCTRLYVTERAALEFPGFKVDFDDNAEWKDRSCPSMAALELSERYEGSEIVWVTSPHDHDEDPYSFSPEEAVVVRKFLGKYDLIHYLGDPA